MQKTTLFILIITAALIGAVAWFIFSGAKQSAVAGEYDTFAECLYENGMRMYGSVTCSFCERQRKLFGPSFEFIREIECDPRNEGSQTELCIQKNITHTPTWIHEDADGNDITRFEPGVQSLEALADESGCPLVKDVPVSGTEN